MPNPFDSLPSAFATAAEAEAALPLLEALEARAEDLRSCAAFLQLEAWFAAHPDALCIRAEGDFEGGFDLEVFSKSLGAGAREPVSWGAARSIAYDLHDDSDVFAPHALERLARYGLPQAALPDEPLRQLWEEAEESLRDIFRVAASKGRRFHYAILDADCPPDANSPIGGTFGPGSAVELAAKAGLPDLAAAMEARLIGDATAGAASSACARAL